MHILVTADAVGGVWTYARELVSGLAGRGIRVTLVSFGEIPSPSQMDWMKALPNLDFYPTAFKLEWMRDTEDDLARSAEYLQKLVRELKPDLLHLNQFYYGALSCDVPRIVVAHSDVVSWWLAVHGEEPPASDWMRWYRSIVTRGLQCATVVIAPSHWMLEQISRHYVEPKSGSVIYNGRTPTLFHPYLKKDKLIVTVGRQWDRAKNAALLLQQPMPAPICIIGCDRHPESKASAFSGNGFGSAVQFKPQQDEKQLSWLLAKSSIYAATSCYEPFGLAPVEAAFSGCAIVANDIPSFRELWDDAALFFHNNDSASLREMLSQLSSDRELRECFARLACERANQRFNATRMVDEYINLYGSLVRETVVAA